MGRRLYEELPGEPGTYRPDKTTATITRTPGIEYNKFNGWR